MVRTNYTSNEFKLWKLLTKLTIKILCHSHVCVELIFRPREIIYKIKLKAYTFAITFVFVC